MPTTNKNSLHMQTLTCKQAVAVYRGIQEDETNLLWKWYIIGYSIIAGGFAQQTFCLSSGADKSTVSMACSIARDADKNDKYREMLEEGEFVSLRDAYDNRPSKKTNKRKPVNRGEAMADRYKTLTASEKRAFLKKAGLKAVSR